MVFLSFFRKLFDAPRNARWPGESLWYSYQRGRHLDGNVIAPDKRLKQAQIQRITRSFFGRKSKTYSMGIVAAHRAMRYSTIARFVKKQQMRELWEMRISSACAEHGMEYKNFMAALSESNVLLNRKTLNDLCIFEPRSFQSLVVYAKQRIDEVGIHDPEEKPVPEGLMTKTMAQRMERRRERRQKRRERKNFE